MEVSRHTADNNLQTFVGIAAAAIYYNILANFYFHSVIYVGIGMEVF